MFWSLRSQLQCFCIKFDGACHLKNYCFVITYLLEDEQELSLGMLIRCKHIYHFLCSMLVLHQLSYVLSMLRGTFYAFSGTNLLKRCPSASSCFLLFLVSEILHRKCNIPEFSKFWKIKKIKTSAWNWLSWLKNHKKLKLLN